MPTVKAGDTARNGDIIYSVTPEKERILKDRYSGIEETVIQMEWLTDGSIESAKKNKMTAEDNILRILNKLQKHSDIKVCEVLIKPGWQSTEHAYIRAELQ